MASRACRLPGRWPDGGRRVLSQGGRGDALLLHMSSYLTLHAVETTLNALWQNRRHIVGCGSHQSASIYEVTGCSKLLCYCWALVMWIMFVGTRRQITERETRTSSGIIWVFILVSWAAINYKSCIKLKTLERYIIITVLHLATFILISLRVRKHGAHSKMTTFCSSVDDLTPDRYFKVIDLWKLQKY